MTYRLVLSEGARKQIKKLDKHVGLMLANEMKKRLDGLSNPRQHGKALVGDKKGLWRYRVGAYRIICDIQDDKLIILALEVGHRKNIYE
ncbi:type II toxin-antitoxin system RelE/ParE family toxin [Aerococcaceae bacterium NML190073]|nr:type II toxin-antitoxin system RelE/ParE family toxin [Aerococcaceae bacterium NML190073]MCW6676762.1 type II toxin-antitoxin system RelE/ParE family toxin [Aerococcaceae bacterium NML180378]